MYLMSVRASVSEVDGAAQCSWKSEPEAVLVGAFV